MTHEEKEKDYTVTILYVNGNHMKDVIEKQAIRFIFDYAFHAGKNGWENAEIFFNNYESDGLEKPTEVIVKLKRKKE